MLSLPLLLLQTVHFFLIKFHEQEVNVPEGAPFYWVKRIAPPLEFGAMHAILLQSRCLLVSLFYFWCSLATHLLNFDSDSGPDSPHNVPSIHCVSLRNYFEQIRSTEPHAPFAHPPWICDGLYCFSGYGFLFCIFWSPL